MAKGTQAKVNVQQIMAKAFGSDWIGEYDKKFYVWADDGGEKVQIAISLTCPKTQVAVAAAPASNNLNFEDDAPSTVVSTTGFQPAEITPEERARVNDLMAKLGL